MISRIKHRDALNVVGPFLAAYGWVAFFCFFYLVERWAHAAPTSPNAAHGYVYPHNEHGWVTYFSAFQATAAALLFSTSIPISFVGILVSPKRDVIYRRGFLSISAKWDPDDPRRLQRFGFFGGAAAAPIIVFLFGPSLVESLNASGIVLPFG
ncbi:MAG: hypothetical protein JWO15_107 [Sphingomonadales bacterium]|nr:hypothetical protein [Sphingomonadales bacterium]